MERRLSSRLPIRARWLETIRTMKKYLIGASAVLVVVCAAFLGFVAWPAWHRFSVEDRIHGAFYAVVNALYLFHEDTGACDRALAARTEVPHGDSSLGARFRHRL